METNSNFSIPRIGYLIRKDFWESRKTIGIIALAVLGFCTLIYMSFDIGDEETPNQVSYILLLFIGGFIFTSIIFREFYTKPRGQFYLNLPASNFEKLASKWLITAIIYPIGVTLFYWLFTLIANPIYTYLNGTAHVSFYSDWTNGLSDLPYYYIMTQALFFLGAITFTKYNFFKTGFSVFALGLFLVSVFAFLFRFVMWGYFEGMQFRPERNGVQLEPSGSFHFFLDAENIVYLPSILAISLAAFLLVVSYFKLKEREI